MLRIQIERQLGFYGMIRALVIVVDGVPVARIQQRESIVVEVPPGSREIWGKMDWGETERLNLHEYRPDLIVVFRGYFTLNPFKTLGITQLPFKAFFRDGPESARFPSGGGLSGQETIGRTEED
jgi:hypothetical protein